MPKCLEPRRIYISGFSVTLLLTAEILLTGGGHDYAQDRTYLQSFPSHQISLLCDKLLAQ